MQKPPRRYRNEHCVARLSRMSIKKFPAATEISLSGERSNGQTVIIRLIYFLFCCIFTQQLKSDSEFFAFAVPPDIICTFHVTIS